MITSTLLTLALALSPAGDVDWSRLNPPDSTPTPPRALTVAEAEDECIRTGKPLYVWLRYACKSTEVRLPEGIHVHTEDAQVWNDQTINNAGVIIVVHRPDIRAKALRRVSVIAPEDVCVNNLRRPVEEDKRSRGRPVLQINHNFAPASLPAAQPWTPAPTFGGGRAWGSRG